LIFELGDDVLVEEEGGDGGVWVGEVFVEACLLEMFPNIVHLNMFKL